MNLTAFWGWFIRALICGGCGAVAGVTIAAMYVATELGRIQAGDAIGVLLGGVAAGAALVGAIPAVIATWFLFLHMLSQLSDAVRGRE